MGETRGEGREKGRREDRGGRGRESGRDKGGREREGKEGG